MLATSELGERDKTTVHFLHCYSLNAKGLSDERHTQSFSGFKDVLEVDLRPVAMLVNEIKSACLCILANYSRPIEFEISKCPY